MELARADVQQRPDGQRVIDILLRPRRRQDDDFAAPVAGSAAEEPLVVPRFDDEESDSSSDEEGGGPHRHGNPTAPQASRIPKIKPTARRSARRDNNDDGDGDDDVGGPDAAASGSSFAGGEMQWAGVHQIQQLTNANAALSDQVGTLKRQLKAMEIQVEALAPVPGLNAAAVQDILLDKDAVEHDARDAKIVHQARTIRQLKRAAQRDKQIAADATKLSKAAEDARVKLEKEVETLRLKVQRLEARATASSSPATDDTSPAPAASTSSPALTEVKKQCEELKAKNAALQTELKRTQRALVREAGEEIPLDEIVNGSSAGGEGRRGRAQQIIMLKAKVKKLQANLTAATASTAAPVEGKSDAGGTTAPALDVDDRAHKELANQAVHRQKQLDKLAAERDALQESAQQLSRKLEALKSRAQVLDKEKQDAKAKLQVLVDKSRTDDAFVDVLQRQVEVWKGKFQDAKRELRGSSERAETPSGGGQRSMPAPSEASQFRALAVEKERLSELVKSLGAQLEEKDKQLRAAAGNQPQQPLVSVQQLQHQSSAMLLPGLVGPSRIPRKPMRPGTLSRGDDALTPPSSSGSSRSRVEELEAEMETLRRTFRDSLRDKDEQIAALERKQRSLAEDAATRSSRGASERETDPSTSLSDRDDDAQALAQEVEDLQEENQFLRDEFDKLKARYEAITRASQASSRR